MEEEQAVELKSKMERLNVGEWHEDDGSVFVGDVLIERLANVLILSDDDLKAHIAERLGEPSQSATGAGFLSWAVPPVESTLGAPILAPVESAEPVESTESAPEVPEVAEAPLVPDAEA